MSHWETVLIAVAGGVVAFGLAAWRIISSAAKRTLDLHFLRVDAARLRNKYALQILSLQDEPVEVCEVTAEPEMDAQARAA